MRKINIRKKIKANELEENSNYTNINDNSSKLMQNFEMTLNEGNN